MKGHIIIFFHEEIIRAVYFTVKDVLKNKDGNDVKIKKVEKKKGSFPVFNITVDNAHTFYAGESKVLVKSK